MDIYPLAWSLLKGKKKLVVTMAPEFIIQEVFQVFPLTNNTAISVEMSLSIQKMEHCMRVAMLLRVIIMSSMHYLLCLLFSS
jgi:hypothetical protein